MCADSIGICARAGSERGGDLVEARMNNRITRIGIAISWSALRDKMKEYLDGLDSDDEHVLRAIALSDFLIWLGKQQRRKRQETSDETKQN